MARLHLSIPHLAKRRTVCTKSGSCSMIPYRARLARGKRVNQNEASPPAMEACLLEISSV
jgi:hypothetical protein